MLNNPLQGRCVSRSPPPPPAPALPCPCPEIYGPVCDSSNKTHINREAMMTMMIRILLS